MKHFLISSKSKPNYVIDSSIDPLVRDFKKHLPKDELRPVNAKVKMCVDAFANIEKLDPRETQDEIDCLEMSKHSDNLNSNFSSSSFLNIDLVDEIHCQELKGRKKPRMKAKSPQKKPTRKKARKKEDLSLTGCLLCDSSFGSFSKLLNHITSIHFQSEVRGER